MRKSFPFNVWLTALLLLGSFANANGQQTDGTAEEAGVHRFATFNVRYTNPSNGDTGDKLWANRGSFVARIVTDYDFDIVGMEEVIGNNHVSQSGKSQFQDLRDMLPDYADWAVEREGRQYEYNVIFYKKQKYELLEKGRFYLNEHPETPGPGWADGEDQLPRALGWVHLRDKASGQDFYFGVAHTNYGASKSGIESCRLIGQRMREMAGQKPVVLVGDFNMRRNDHNEAWRGVASCLSDAALCTETTCIPKGNITHTASNWLPATDPGCKGSEFDYVFYKHMIPLSRYIITEDYDRGIAPSDHFPLLVRFRFPSESAQTLPRDARGVYQIATPRDLLEFSTLVSTGETGADGALTADIDMSQLGSDWKPIGTETHPFLGSFDGQGHEITGFNYTTAGRYAGLFGFIKGSEICNFSILGKLVCRNKINGVVGYCAYTSIHNVNSALEITATQSGIAHTGGIVGSAQDVSRVGYCSFSGSVTVGSDNHDCFGGICGYANSCLFENCANYGRVSYAKADCYAGGILGYVNHGGFPGLHHCLSVGRVRYTGSGSAQYGGALIGRLRSYSTSLMGDNYWLLTSASNASGENKSNKFHSVTSRQLQSGEVCFALNEGQDPPVWYQTLGEDTYPLLDATRQSVIRNEDGTFANPTGVDEVHSAELRVHSGIYDLGGRQFSDSSSPGLYIVNGKKILPQK